MKRFLFLLSLAILPGCSTPSEWQTVVSAAPAGQGQACDSAGFLKAAAEAEHLRVKRRLSAEAFAQMAREPHTIVLDARSRENYQVLRIKGSLNLPYTVMAAESLAQAIPDPGTRILIYCRNNIYDTKPAHPVSRATSAGSPRLSYPDEFDPPEIPKMVSAGLNIPTYITLYIYGYKNVWELDPAVDPNHSAIEFETGLPKRR